MSNSDMQSQRSLSHLSGGSMSYVDALYEDYLNDPLSVSEQWRKTFDELPSVNGEQQEASHQAVRDYFLHYAKTKHLLSDGTDSGDAKQASVTQFINEFRAHGHHLAQLDPIGMAKRVNVPSLELSYHQLSEQDFDKPFYPGKTLSSGKMSLRDIKAALEQTYCRNIGIEYMHISDEQERA